MKTKKVLLPITAACALGLIIFFTMYSCDKEYITAETPTGGGNIILNLTDAPGDFQAVYVQIDSVSVHWNPDSGKTAWVELPTKDTIYDLIQLQDGVYSQLTEIYQLGDGKITQIRLVLGDSCTCMVDDTLYTINVPSGVQSGIKIHTNLTISSTDSITIITLDYDAAESIHKTGNGKYEMRPTIKLK